MRSSGPSQHDSLRVGVTEWEVLGVGTVRGTDGQSHEDRISRKRFPTVQGSLSGIF